MRLKACLAAATMLVIAPNLAAAQPYGPPPPPPPGWAPAPDYGRGDVCRWEQHRATQQGAVTGGILGATAGFLLGGRGHKVAGAALGGAVGATAGGAVAHNNFRCMDYPQGYYRHPHCRWVSEGDHAFEVCRGPDGYWRPWRG
jgi:hypothetical protein